MLLDHMAVIMVDMVHDFKLFAVVLTTPSSVLKHK